MRADRGGVRELLAELIGPYELLVLVGVVLTLVGLWVTAGGGVALVVLGCACVWCGLYGSR